MHAHSCVLHKAVISTLYTSLQLTQRFNKALTPLPSLQSPHKYPTNDKNHYLQ